MVEISRRRAQRILVVDDHLDNALLMRELLSRRGYEVMVAENAATAEQIMRSTPPDLVLLDVIMPGKNGYELCREWKDSPETRLIPVVMITGLSDREDKIRGMRNFANKLWNIGRFLLMNFENKTIPFYDKTMKLTDASDKKIVDSLETLITSVTKDIEKYRFSDAAQALYEFSWHKFADIYLEKNKERFQAGDEQALMVLRHVYLNILKLLHPFMPFVTEEIWSKMPRTTNKPLIIASWPKIN